MRSEVPKCRPAVRLIRTSGTACEAQDRGLAVRRPGCRNPCRSPRDLACSSLDRSRELGPDLPGPRPTGELPRRSSHGGRRPARSSRSSAMEPTASLIVDAPPQALGEVCPYPGCTQVVSGLMWACPQHWEALPAHARRALWLAYGEASGRPTRAVESALLRALDSWGVLGSNRERKHHAAAISPVDHNGYSRTR
jgi:hypothetical protein